MLPKNKNGQGLRHLISFRTSLRRYKTVFSMVRISSLPESETESESSSSSEEWYQSKERRNTTLKIQEPTEEPITQEGALISSLIRTIPVIDADNDISLEIDDWTEVKNKNYFANLPDELLIRIYSFCDIPSIGRLV